MQMFSFVLFFRLCITVIGYQPESSRALEMLIVMNSILPWYLNHIQQTAASDAAGEESMYGLKCELLQLPKPILGKSAPWFLQLLVDCCCLKVFLHHHQTLL